MRQIGTLPDGATARRLADYLLTLKIETRLEEQPGGWLVWVCDEDRVPQAREALAEFQSNPTDTRFTSAARTAHELRLREIEEDEDYQQRLTEFRERMTEPGSANPRILTVGLVVTAVLVSLLTNFAAQPPSGLLRSLLISAVNDGQLTEVAHGEVWRLITPIFIHFDFKHLLFNCLVVLSFAGAIERRQGTPWLLWLVIVFAVGSNLGQFYFGHLFNDKLQFAWRPDPGFGGLSGVAYGLFGYIWMKSRYEPDLGLQMTTLTVVIMVGWFFACLTGLLGSIANAAHAAGLILGLLFGAAPHLWKVLRQR